MAGHGDRGRSNEIEALTVQRPDRRDLTEQNTGQRYRRRSQVAGRRHRLIGCQFPHPPQRLEADGPHHDEFVGDRFQQKFGLPDDPGQFRLDTCRGDELLKVGQPRTAALPAEDDGVRFSGVETVHECVEAGALGVITAQPVVLVNRHLCLSPSNVVIASVVTRTAGRPTALRVP